MKWFEELRITRRPLDEIGLVTVVREVFGNRLAVSRRDADETLGPGWEGVATRLVHAGIMTMTISDGIVRMSTITTTGDAQREKCRARVRRYRKNHQ